jgi:hypothetical protein
MLKIVVFHGCIIIAPWLYLQDLWISLRYTCRAYNYTSKLMIYGFLNFFCVSEGGPLESRAQKG